MIWFSKRERVVFVGRWYGFTISLRAFGEYNRLALRLDGWPHASRG
jgi:hypothetical protein